MLQSSPNPQTWSQFIPFSIGVLTGLIPELVRFALGYKKSHLDNTETGARIERTEAETLSIRLRDDLATGEAVGKMLTTMMSASDKLRSQQERIFELEQDQIELQMKREEVRRMRALLTLNRIPYSEADRFRMPRSSQ
jgi:hypothetical protein